MTLNTVAPLTLNTMTQMKQLMTLQAAATQNNFLLILNVPLTYQITTNQSQNGIQITMNQSPTGIQIQTTTSCSTTSIIPDQSQTGIQVQTDQWKTLIIPSHQSATLTQVQTDQSHHARQI
jgi:hypothetical protein